VSVSVVKKEDGLWLRFQSGNGSGALVNVEAFANERGPVTGAAIRAACAQCASKSKESPANGVEQLQAAIALVQNSAEWLDQEEWDQLDELLVKVAQRASM